MTTHSANRIVKANDKSQLEKVFALRYTTYRDLDIIAPNANEQFSDEFDTSSNSTNYLYYYHDCLMGSIRANLYSLATE